MAGCDRQLSLIRGYPSGLNPMQLILLRGESIVGMSVLLLLAASLSAQTKSADSAFEPAGFVTVPAYDVDHLTGGDKGQGVEVRTAQEFRNACERTDIGKKADQHNAPRVIRVMADIDLGDLANEPGGETIKNVGKVEVRSHTTILGAGEGATIRRGIIDVHGAGDVIIRNLKFRDLWEADPTDKYDRYGWDYIRITNSGKTTSHHVWVDHCDFGKCYDGQIDITHGSDLITVSWCHFSGDERGPQKKSMLIGHSSSPTATALDRGKLNVTLHHNWWQNIADRSPRARCGNIHAFNNFVDGAENATISVSAAVTLVENCVYRDTRVATTFSHAKDSIANKLGGTICIVDSRNENPRVVNSGDDDQSESEETAVDPKPGARKDKDPNRAFELANNFKSNVERAALQFNAPTSWKWPDLNKLPYEYHLDPVDGVAALVSKSASAGKFFEK